MRRYPALLVALAVVAPLVVALPLSRALAPSPHPVTPTVRQVALSLTPHGSEVRSHGFSEVGATWVGQAQPVEVRTHDRRGWSSWQQLQPDDAGPDDGSKDARAAAHALTVASPLWVGRSQQLQARTTRGSAHLTLVLIDPGTSPADAAAGGGSQAEAAQPQPAILSRARWGADERLRSYNGTSCTKPEYSATVKVGFVHHTDNPNGYSSTDVPAIIRSIYAYHVKTRGWCDIGYNFLVDRFGHTWEGRYGGITRPVIGAHTGGFNTNSFGAALIGTYSTAVPSSAMIGALQRLLAWKLGLTWVNPVGKAVLTSAGGGSTKYAAGVKVTFNTISGHRDAGLTDCPGQQVYGRLPQIRTAVKALMGAALTNPSSSRSRTSYQGAGTVVTAGVLKTQTWHLQLRQGCNGVVRRTWNGTTSTSLTVNVDLHDSLGQALRPGTYTLVLTSEAGTNHAVGWTAPLEITTTTPAPAAQTGTGTPAVAAGFVAISPTRVLDTRQGQPIGPAQRRDVQVSGIGIIPAAGVQAVAVQLTTLCASVTTSITGYAADSAQPHTTSMSVPAGESRVVLSQVGLSPAGLLSLANSAGYVDLIADVIGYFPASAGPADAYHPVVPSRLLDTRSTAPLARGGTLMVPVAGQAGVPSSATSVVVNLLALPTAGGGYLSVAPELANAATPFSLLFPASRPVANRMVTGLLNGSFSVYSSVATNVIIDVVGWYGPRGPDGTTYTALRPTRVFTGTVAPSGSQVLAVAGKGGVPADAKTVALVLTAHSTAATDWLTMWSAGARPVTSDLNLNGGANASNLVIVPLGATGTVSLWNAAGTATVYEDVVGYYR